MFTGIIEEVGQVQKREEFAGGIRLTISGKVVLEDLKVGDSVNIDGACQTVVEVQQQAFVVEAVGETLEKTTLGEFRPGRPVNLERALAAGGRFGGHFVQGHVNGVGTISRWYPRGENYYLEVTVPPDLSRYLVREGSIAIDGISLTIAHLQEHRAGISIIPHTVKATTLQFKKVGDRVNVEVDMIARYVEKFLTLGEKGNLTIEKLKQWGYE